MVNAETTVKHKLTVIKNYIFLAFNKSVNIKGLVKTQPN